jgi:hypothetical protein
MDFGYRVWKLRFDEKGSPHLYSVSHTDYEWKPGENVSSLEPHENIADSPKGFYMLSSPTDLKKSNYYPRSGRTIGEIIPYGRVQTYSPGGEVKGGYRAEKAEIRNLFLGGEPCDLCHEEVGNLYFSPNEGGEEWCACKGCLARIKHVLPPSKQVGELELEDVRNRLYRRFEVNVRPATDLKLND